MLQRFIAPPLQTRIMAAYQGWFSMTGTKHVTAYNSADPKVIAKQIITAKERCGISAFSVDGYGYEPDYGDPTNACITAMRPICEQLGFEFNINLDSGIFKFAGLSESDAFAKLSDYVSYCEQEFCTSPAYSRLNGKPLFWEFGLREHGMDIPKLQALHPGISMLVQGQMADVATADGVYDWPVFPPNPIPGNDYSSEALGHMQDWLARPVPAGKIKVPALFWRFDDHDPVNRLTSVWGGPARLIDPRDLQTFIQVSELIRNSGPWPIVQVVTWNDLEERTGFEPIVNALFS